MSKALYVTAIATAGVLAGAYWTFSVYTNTKKRKIPTTWKEVGILKDIIFYPIKSCAPVQRNKAECTYLGLKDGWLRDREMTIVDDKNSFLTARVFPKMLLIHSTIENSVLTLKHDDMEPLTVDLAEVITSQKVIKSLVWGCEVLAYDCGWESSEWLSRLLCKSEKTIRLVLFASDPNRFYTHFFRNRNTTSEAGIYSDETPYNLINESSVNDLIGRLNGAKVTYKNFRTNLVLSGAKAYEEDDWTFLKIGENIFEIIKPCTRCLMTTLDPEKGIRNVPAEPLITLKSYRQVTEPEMRKIAGIAPRMGLQMRLRSGEGNFLSINDIIYAA